VTHAHVNIYVYITNMHIHISHIYAPILTTCLWGVLIASHGAVVSEQYTDYDGAFFVRVLEIDGKEAIIDFSFICLWLTHTWFQPFYLPSAFFDHMYCHYKWRPREWLWMWLSTTPVILLYVSNTRQLWRYIMIHCSKYFDVKYIHIARRKTLYLL